MSKKKVYIAYVAGPYRSKQGLYGVYQNIERARGIAVALWRLGFAVICPHANTAFFDGIGTDDWFLDGDLEIIRRCADLMVMVPGWESSVGARAEMELAKRMGIPICEYPEIPTKFIKAVQGRVNVK